jgi:hypothetical protein
VFFLFSFSFLLFGEIWLFFDKEIGNFFKKFRSVNIRLVLLIFVFG